MKYNIFQNNEIQYLLQLLVKYREEYEDFIVGVTGGYYDPIHEGHIKLIEESNKNCQFLIVCVNNDKATIAKKGYVLLPVQTRMRTIAKFPEVGAVLEVDSTNMVDVLTMLNPSVYLKGGDRNAQTMFQKEIDVCASIGCEIKYGVGGYDKFGSSSDFFKKAVSQYFNHEFKRKIDESIYSK